MKKVVLSILVSAISVFAYENLTIDNFESKIKDKNVIVDFYATWCPPCKILANNLEDFDVIKPDNIEIYKVDIDEQLVLAKKYGVSKLPTLLYFKDGKAIKEYVGVLSKEELLQTTKEDFK
ncbi:thioredoxin [Arcobacter defluvii]|uniref:Thioredoxin n=1 Tax=Arcobacter defluvii TaxID=873191 RepID=A0AAE7E7P8_9BACT|nr:thioredoxin [Arcobacter defluvii]QKF78757.1 thioredoxin [Arcobacter defluvii]RXI33933.1 thioredoxin [Arcobacter defluvii]